MKNNHANEQSLPSENYFLTLYVSGTSPNSLRAINNLKAICEEYLSGKYTLEVIDVYQEKLVAKEQQLIALPLLIKKNPSPTVKLIGDLYETKKVLKALGIKE